MYKRNAELYTNGMFSEASQASYTNKRLIQMSLNVQTECRAALFSEASQASYTNKRLIQMSAELYYSVKLMYKRLNV